MADVRYVGQGYELPVLVGESDAAAATGLVEAFHDAHERRYGYADTTREAEVVTLRVRATAGVARPELASEPPGPPDASGAVVGVDRVVWRGESREAPLYERDHLRSGHAFVGPAVVVEYSTTTLVPPDVSCRVDERANLILGGW